MHMGFSFHVGDLSLHVYEYFCLKGWVLKVTYRGLQLVKLGCPTQRNEAYNSSLTFQFFKAYGPAH